MKISETTSYPHPLLAPWSNDILGAKFSADITYREDDGSQQLSIHCEVSLEQPDLAELIDTGAAGFGCFIRCKETGFRRVQHLGFPKGVHHFSPGALLGRVEIRPMVWAIRPILSYLPEGAHPEFLRSDIKSGQILALDDEQVIDVRRPPLPSVESIFEIDIDASLGESQFEVDTGGDRIVIRMAKNTFSLVQFLRGTDETTQTVVMNSLYIPVLMSLLDQIKKGADPFEGLRWFQPFSARCEQLGIDIKDPDLVNDAQKLLEFPFSKLSELINSAGGQDNESTS